MGCCESFCKKDNGSQGDTFNERTPLLENPVTNITNIQPNHRYKYIIPHVSPVPKVTDEQSQVKKILHEMATNLIDVNALDWHFHQQECMERSKAYTKKIEEIGVLVPRHPPCLLKDVPTPERVLASEGLGAQDRDMMTDMLTGAVTALSDMQVEHKEDLVVPFSLRLSTNVK